MVLGGGNETSANHPAVFSLSSTTHSSPHHTDILAYLERLTFRILNLLSMPKIQNSEFHSSKTEPDMYLLKKYLNSFMYAVSGSHFRGH